jgi:hypothetical protein
MRAAWRGVAWSGRGVGRLSNLTRLLSGLPINDHELLNANFSPLSNHFFISDKQTAIEKYYQTMQRKQN